jgi:eukaryotic-like serine/threonine-protein kinase
MGEVYRARDTKLNRDVALKILPDAFASDPDRMARFTREAQTLAALNHPNIAHIYGLEGHVGQGGTAPACLVMELIEGDDLSQRIARGPIPVAEVLPIAKQIAEALEAAHEQGIIHRDLKPANIKLKARGAPPPRTEDGRLERSLSPADLADCTVKVLDFGLAKALDPTPTSSPNVTNSPTITTPAMMTGVGMILGTAAYMSPEQARGKPADKRADIWAFGVVVFEMLTGQRLFTGETISDTLASVLKTGPNWQALPVDTPAALQRLLRRCLEKDPRRRLQAIGEARVQIDDLLSGVPDTAGAPAILRALPLRQRALPWASTGVLAVGLAAVLGLWAPWRAAAPPHVTRTAITPSGTAALTIDRNFGDVALSPDGTHVVYVGNKGTQLFVRALDTLEPVAIATGRSLRAPFVSPDGQWVGFMDGVVTLRKVAITGGRRSRSPTFTPTLRAARRGPPTTQSSSRLAPLPAPPTRRRGCSAFRLTGGHRRC